MKARRLLPLLFCATLGGAWMHGASAQNAAPSVQQPVPAYSESELKTFAVAALEVLRINDVYLPKLKMASTPEEQQLVERTASDEMVKAVEREGMSVAKYKEIMTYAESNPEIAERVIKHMKDAQSAPGAGR